MLKQKYFLTDFFILSAEKQPIKSSWRKIEWLLEEIYKGLAHFVISVGCKDKVNLFTEKLRKDGYKVNFGQ